MPSSIPYDPSLVMGQIVNKEALQNVEDIAGYEAPADAAQDKYNGLLASKRSLDMTLIELTGLKLGEDALKPLQQEIEAFNKDVALAAVDYAKAKIVSEQNIAKVRAKIPQVHVQWESPVDYNRTGYKTFPLAADSINLDVQYFSTETNDQKSQSSADDIASFATAKMEKLGAKRTAEFAANVKSQVSSQREKHDIEGTLVIAATCTHKNATVLAPFIMNVDKAIKVWNQMHPDQKDRINPTSPAAMLQLAEEIESPEGVDGKGKPSMTIISGVTYGSSFVGMVHILRSSSTMASEKLKSIASKAQVQLEVGAFFNKMQGGFGVDASFSNDVKNLLSTQNVQSHVTMTCMGLIPTLKSNEIQLGVKQFASFDPRSSMEQIQEIQNATVADQATVDSAAAAARTGGEMVAMQGGKVKAALSALGDIDKENNKILDINSMMEALDDYIAKAANLTGGVPINYYLKPITKDMLAEMWISKYYPGEYMQIKGDDSEDSKKPGDNNNSSSNNNNTTSGGDENEDS
ncbi:uncharacterized protein TrAtP1_012078 [Trichoderma atroviride]|uniref:Uncharacterized protein n=1 Tax=Hypocrea atroviridis (strain ATCC 20476 / IMI 206040) TaxID=452589 RepID=G9NNX9_HYPAI|nr:uncharacterized protein TRIATDRAFT_90250 [Trichoderma atroviride IMI 206040]EHK47766.1 hypothetical protein TRIATDRAFT_90250 [Trichoderma atroviride IMI 206040]UKZ71115.1 hypothetical protein TrAtP1_012078 [Trichoderma atroviride]